MAIWFHSLEKFVGCRPPELYQPDLEIRSSDLNRLEREEETINIKDWLDVFYDDVLDFFSWLLYHRPSWNNFWVRIS